MSTTYNPDEPLSEELSGSVESIMAYLLQKYAPGLAQLSVPVSPQWMINPYLQERMPVWEALERFAQMIGWELRWRWSRNSRSVGQLTFYEPDTVGQQVGGIDPNVYYDLTQYAVSTDNIRNRVYVYFGPPEAREWIMAESVNSIQFYRYPRIMWIEESSTSPLQTEAEAQRLANVAVAELAYSEIKVSLTLPYYPLIELGDYLGLEANQGQVRSPGSYHVTSIRHEFGQGNAKTILGLVRGPATASKGRWKRGELRKGVKYL